MRETSKIKDGLEIFTEDNTIILKKYEPYCVFCGEARDVSDFKGKNLCNRIKRNDEQKGIYETKITKETGNAAIGYLAYRDWPFANYKY